MAIAVLVGGCASSGDQASPLPTGPTASVSATPTPKATTPKQQVEATVRAYYEAMDLGIRTGNVDPYLALTTSDCNCRDLAREVKRIFARGTTANAGVRLLRVPSVAASGAGSFDAEAVVRVAAYQEVDEDGEVLKAFEAKDTKRLLSLVPKQDGYLVRSVVFEGNLK